jgi:hypothetical protein
MARAQDKKKDQDEDVAVDQYGRPLPTVTLRTKDGVVVDIHDASALSNLHYGQGYGFAEDGVTYASALAVLLGEDREAVLVDVPSDGGDVVWPTAHILPAPADEQGDKDEPGKKSG